MFEYLCNGIQKQGEVKMENQEAVDEKEELIINKYIKGVEEGDGIGRQVLAKKVQTIMIVLCSA